MALRNTMDDRIKRILDFAKKHFVTEYSFDDSASGLPITKKYFSSALLFFRKIAQKIADNEAPAWLIEVAMTSLTRVAGHREATSYAFYFAMQEKMDGNIEVLTLQQGEDWFYSVMVLGRDPRTPINDLMKWNQEARICDVTRGIDYSPSEIREKLKINEKMVFCIRHGFYGKQTPENLQANIADLKIARKIQDSLHSNSHFHQLVYKSKEMQLLNEHFKQYLTKEELNRIVELSNDPEVIKKYLGQFGMGFSQDLQVKIKAALNDLTRDISTMEWGMDPQGRSAMLRCNSLQEADFVKAVFDNNSIFKTQCTIHLTQPKPTTVVSPIPKIDDIKVLIQMRAVEKAIQLIK